MFNDFHCRFFYERLVKKRKGLSYLDPLSKNNTNIYNFTFCRRDAILVENMKALTMNNKIITCMIPRLKYCLEITTMITTGPELITPIVS